MDVWEIDQRHENYFENSIVSSLYEKNNEMKKCVNTSWVYNTVL